MDRYFARPDETLETVAPAAAGVTPDQVRVARDIVPAGNTSAASIPLALESLRAEGCRGGRPC